jgi:hypothetical protein
MGYYGIDPSYYTVLYASLGFVCLAAGRILDVTRRADARENSGGMRENGSRGLALCQCGNGILLLSCLAAFMQGLGALTFRVTWLDVGVLAATAAVSALAVPIAVDSTWRRLYACAAIAISVIACLELNWLINLNGWQKLEVFSTVVGVALLAVSHWGIFREVSGTRQESVSLGIDFGSLLAVIPLVIAVFYHRWFGSGPSVVDEIALLTVTVLMLVTGVGWQIRTTTLLGGGALAFYLVVMLASLLHHPQLAVGVYLSAGGAIVFATGIALSIYRDKLLEIPEHVANRDGIFTILNWR